MAQASRATQRIKPANRIQTPRLVLRTWRLTDGPLLAAAIEANLDHLRAAGAWPDNESPVLQNVQRHIDRFERLFRAESEWWYAVFSESEQFLYGAAGMRRGVDRGVLEIDAWLQQAWMKHGYATEAVRAIADAALNQPGITRVHIRCDATNDRAARVASRAGFRHATTVKDMVASKSHPRDLMVWELARPGATPTESTPSARSLRSPVHAILSLIVPGLGQLVQGRLAAAALQLVTLAAYVAWIVKSGETGALGGVAAWNLLSAVDAYRHPRRS